MIQGEVMTDLQAIDRRTSRRSYAGTSLSQEDCDAMIAWTQWADQASGLSFMLMHDGREAFQGLHRSYGLFDGVRSVLLIKGSRQDSDRKEKAGYYGERIVLEATKRGLGTCWVGGTYRRSSIMPNVADEEELICVITIGNVEERRSFRETIIHGLTARRSKTVQELVESDESLPEWFLRGIHAVQKAPTAVNSQKFIFTYQNGKVSAHVPDRSMFDLVDLGIGKLHFEIGSEAGHFAPGNHGEFIKQ
jgi:nitroreductase